MNRLFARGGGVIAAGWRFRHMAATADLCDKFGDSVKVVDAALAFRSFGQRKAFGGPSMARVSSALLFAKGR